MHEKNGEKRHDEAGIANDIADGKSQKAEKEGNDKKCKLQLQK
jgi:hypothetical protein